MSKAKANRGLVIAAPAGESAQARGGEFEQKLDRLARYADQCEAAAGILTPASDDSMETARLQYLEDAEAIRWAIEELRKHDH